MIKLQYNFTTPEQSKLLLDLGLPADSADCVFEKKRIGTKFIMSKTPDVIPQTMKLCWKVNNRIPCWSVGRLMEIHDICITDLKTQYGWAMAGGYDYINYIISRFEDEVMDFSKLED